MERALEDLSNVVDVDVVMTNHTCEAGGCRDAFNAAVENQGKLLGEGAHRYCADGCAWLVKFLKTYNERDGEGSADEPLLVADGSLLGGNAAGVGVSEEVAGVAEANIAGAPFEVVVDPAAADARFTTAKGAGLYLGNAGYAAPFTILAKDAWGNDLRATSARAQVQGARVHRRPRRGRVRVRRRLGRRRRVRRRVHRVRAGPAHGRGRDAGVARGADDHDQLHVARERRGRGRLLRRARRRRDARAALRLLGRRPPPRSAPRRVARGGRGRARAEPGSDPYTLPGDNYLDDDTARRNKGDDPAATCTRSRSPTSSAACHSSRCGARSAAGTVVAATATRAHGTTSRARTAATSTATSTCSRAGAREQLDARGRAVGGRGPRERGAGRHRAAPGLGHAGPQRRPRRGPSSARFTPRSTATRRRSSGNATALESSTRSRTSRRSAACTSSARRSTARAARATSTPSRSRRAAAAWAHHELWRPADHRRDDQERQLLGGRRGRRRASAASRRPTASRRSSPTSRTPR